MIGNMTKYIVLMAILLGLPTLGGGVQEFNGQGEGGAFYSIEAPDDWSPADGLVIYNHGFDIGPVDPDPGPHEMRLGEGASRDPIGLFAQGLGDGLFPPARPDLR